MSAEAPPRLAVVIPVFNGWEQTERCLIALRESLGAEFRIIVVDHGSTDRTKFALPENFPEVQIVSGLDSLWWSGATNLGIRAAMLQDATAVMLLNNDAYVEKNAVQRLLAHHLEFPDAVVAGGQRTLEDLDLEVQRSTSCLLFGFTTLRRPRSWMNRPNSKGLWRVNLIVGGRGVIIPLEIVRSIGLLDEIRLPHYGADHDFYWRCNDAGIALYVASDAWVHIDNTSTSIAGKRTCMRGGNLRRLLSDRRSHRNLAAHRVMFQKHYPIRSLYWIGLSLFLLRYTLIALFERLSIGNLASGKWKS